ncbi:MAG TPA: hypothetical protein VFP65_02250 [Anaeromyxobacteraceae bacterium]|nr:hypothetical protein [Anaeromyxobacteraceae bacterium]
MPTRALPAIVLAAALVPGSVRAQDDDEYTFTPPPPERDHFHLSALGGVLFSTSGRSETYEFAGVEGAFVLDSADLGVLVQGYHLGTQRANAQWSPVILARFLNRFETARGLEATFGIGIGAGRANGWTTWYQLVLGMRLIEGPIFITGELGFEQLDLFRLGGGLGIRF